MDHVGIVVEDLDQATVFFVELGLRPQGVTPVAGEWVDRVVGLEGVRLDIVMLATPDGHSRLELARFHAPAGPGQEGEAAANVPGLRHLTFVVDDIEAVVRRLEGRGAELIGEIAEFEDRYRLCYLRGPAGVIVELAAEIG